MLNKKTSLAFTLIEVLIAVAIVAIISAIAVPSYQKYTYSARRHEAIADLLKLQLLEERYRNYNSGYASEEELEVYNGGALPALDTNYYTYSISDVSNTTYTITATAVGNPDNDQVQGTTCSPLTINEQGTKTPAVCWSS